MHEALSLERLVDELIDAYVDWCDTCARVNDAYRFWSLETGSRDRVGFALYTAALDAEEQAAGAYAALVSRVYERLWDDEPPAEALGIRARGVGRS